MAGKARDLVALGWLRPLDRLPPRDELTFSHNEGPASVPLDTGWVRFGLGGVLQPSRPRGSFDRARGGSCPGLWRSLCSD
jgi:hypothetical protein